MIQCSLPSCLAYEFGPPSSPQRAHHLRNWVSLSGAVVALGSFFCVPIVVRHRSFRASRQSLHGTSRMLSLPGFSSWSLSDGPGLLDSTPPSPQSHPECAPHALTIDLSRPAIAKGLAGFVIGSVLFLLCTALGSYRTYHYTESVQFCGQACHTPMKPDSRPIRIRRMPALPARNVTRAGRVGFFESQIKWRAPALLHSDRRLSAAYQDARQKPALTQSTCEQLPLAEQILSETLTALTRIFSRMKLIRRSRCACF